MSDAAMAAVVEDEAAAAGVPPLGIDIEHIADGDTWAEQAWRLIRQRREHERKEVEDRERARLDEQAQRRRDEKEWRERQALLSQQRAAALDTAELPSSSAHRRARTARRERRASEEDETSAVDIRAAALSGWQQRGLLHVWSTGAGGREQEDRERREIWEGNMRGKRAQLDRIDADRNRPPTADKRTGRRAAQQRRPHTAAAAYRPAAANSTQPSSAARSAWTARTRHMSPPPTAPRPAARPCIRCALPSTSFTHVAQGLLVAEHEHLSRLLPPSHAAAVPAAVRHLYPQLSAEQYVDECSGDSRWLATQVEVCRECAEWLDESKHSTARRATKGDTSSARTTGSGEQQQSVSDDQSRTTDDGGDAQSTGARSITQLVNRLLTMPAPSCPLGGYRVR